MSTETIDELNDTIEEALVELRRIDPTAREKQLLDEAYLHLRKAQEALQTLANME